MRQFFKFVLAVIVGLLLFLIIGIFILVSFSESPAPIEKNSVLKLDLNKRIIERETDRFFGNLPAPFGSGEGTIGLLELRQAISFAKEDNRIKGIFLRLYDTNTGLGTLEELRNALIDFKESGKFIVAYGESYSEGSYYLASVADRIFLPPMGMVEFNGFSAELLFFKNTLEKLDLKTEIFKVGDYKSAVEPWTNEKMSEENRAQMSSLLQAVNGHFIASVAAARNINPDLLKQISDSMLVRNGKDALEHKLVTDLAYFSEAEDYIKQQVETDKDGKIRYVTYTKFLFEKAPEDKADANNKVAVIFATGIIQPGEGGTSNIGSESMVREIKKARDDDKVKAIVLRINSPGGSALASDLIWKELTLAGKPVIASMSDVAASGGYYLAMACDTIVAHPSTITGSIGVYGVMINGTDFLKNKLGITSDRVKTGQFSDIGSFTREMTPYERSIIQNEVERIYQEFTGKAAEGRNMSKEEILRLARGRVWAGSEAKANKLIDAYGGLEEAVRIAAARAGISDDYNVQYLPVRKPLIWKRLLTMFGDDESSDFMEEEFGSFYPYIRSMKDVQKIQGIQMRLPFDVMIR